MWNKTRTVELQIPTSCGSSYQRCTFETNPTHYFWISRVNLAIHVSLVIKEKKTKVFEDVCICLLVLIEKLAEDRHAFFCVFWNHGTHIFQACNYHDRYIAINYQLPLHRCNVKRRQQLLVSKPTLVCDYRWKWGRGWRCRTLLEAQIKLDYERESTS